MSPSKKKHHYVPETYLQNFAGERGFLHVYRKDDPDKLLPLDPSEAAFRKYYYSQPIPSGGVEHSNIEHAFGIFEKDWPSTYHTLASREPPNKVLSHLLIFSMMQLLRVPAFRDAVEQSLHRVARADYERFKEAGLLPPPPAGFPDLADKVEIVIDPHQSIHALIAVKDQVGPIFDSFGYVIVHNESGLKFLTSDNPVCYFLTQPDDNLIQPYSWDQGKDRELFFPLSPTLALYGSQHDRERFRRKGLKYSTLRDRKLAARFNRLVARFGYELLIASDPLPSTFVNRFAGQSPVLSPSFPGFYPEEIKLPPFTFGQRQKLKKWDKTRYYSGAQAST